MFKEGATAHTSYGSGTIKEVDTVRGSTSYRVAGRGFDVWVDSTKIHVATDEFGDASGSGVAGGYGPGASGSAQDHGFWDQPVGGFNPYDGKPDDGTGGIGGPRVGGLDTTIEPATDVNDDNYAVLPYDPSPQHHVDLFRDEQTIQPGEYPIDPDERLHSSEDGESHAPNRPYPGPAPHLFAFNHTADADAGDDEFGDGPESPDWGDDEWHKDLPDGPERTFGKEASTYRPAGLSGRYAHFDIEAHDGMDPVSQFQRDPYGFIHTAGYIQGADDGDYLIQKFADYTNLLDTDKHLRTAKWHDVRNKAQRLRSEGRVHVKHVTPEHIYASVDGDNGTYDTMIVKGSSGAFTAGQSVANWHCGCEWGRWAFKRKFSYVGRLCSHAYAAYLDMQSNYHKDNKGKFKAAGIVDKFKSWSDDTNEGHMDEGSISDYINTCGEDVSREDVDKLYDYLLTHEQQAPERDYDTGYTLDNDEAYKTADALRLKPKSLTPDFREVPEKGDNEWVDVTKDDRKTTGPDQIMKGAAYGEPPEMGAEEDPDLVHFSSRWVESLHRTSAPGDWNDQMNTMGQDRTGPAGAPEPPGGKEQRPYNSETGQYGDLDPNGKQQEAYTPEPTPGGGQWQQPGYAGPDPTLGMPGRSNTQELHPAQGATTLDQAFAGGTTQQGAPTDPGAVRAQNNSEVAKSTVPPAGQAGATTDTAPGGAASGAPIGQGGSYHVNQGDTLSDIAQRAGLGKDNYQQIADANKDKISDPNHIETGWDLKIPGQPASQAGTTTGQNPFSSMPNPDGSQSKFHGDGPGTEPAPAAPNPFSSMPNPNGTQSQFHGDGPGTAPSPPGLTQPKIPEPPKVPPVPGSPGASGGQSITNPGLTPPGQTSFPNTPGKKGNRRYAESSDSGLLDKLRSMSEEGCDDDLGHMDSRNDELRDLVEELQDRGYDASFAVASLHSAAPRSQFSDDDPSDGNANFLGQSSPNWADETFAGSGPDPKEYFSDSASYIDKHERPEFEDVTDLPDGDIIKFNDSRSKPPQGPRRDSRRHASPDSLMDAGAADVNAPTLGDYTADPSGGAGVDMLAALHYSGQPTAQDWDDGDWMGKAADEVQQHAPGGGGGDEGAEGAMEEAPELMALARRVGHGPRQAPRVDPGPRGQHQAAMPRHMIAEDEGDDAGVAQEAPNADILSSFHRSGAADFMMTNQSTPGDDNIAGAAQAFLRTAGRVFSPEDQHALEQESHVLGARNMPTDDDLAGTHYLLGM